jgi:long-chain acyl-CoA synthetase
VGIRVYEGFGQTESAGLISLNLPHECRIGSVGRALPGTQLRLGEDGEILAAGPHVFAGYLHNADATEATIDEEGWLNSCRLNGINPEVYLADVLIRVKSARRSEIRGLLPDLWKPPDGEPAARWV